MNNKIKELQKAAGIQVVRTLMREDENTEVKLMLTESQLEKFAELLEKEFEAKHFSAGYIAGRSDGTIETVKECAEQIIAKGTDWVDFAPSQTGVRPEYWNMAQQIKQHFGVEL